MASSELLTMGPTIYPHCLTTDEICTHFKVNKNTGLSSYVCEERLKEFGNNELPPEPTTSIFEMVIAQFNDLLIWVLIMAAFISFILAMFETDVEEGLMAFVEPAVIILILVINAIVGVIQESNAEKALSALKELQPHISHCLRDGKWTEISAKFLVPGDIVLVNVGDKVPADLRIIELKRALLKAEQSQLTGESSSVTKSDEVLPKSDKHTVLQGRINLLFSSTTISVGSALACVYATGINTEIGKIQSAVIDASQEEYITPLKRKLDEFAKLLTYVISMICVFVWLINYKNFFDPIHGSLIAGCIYYFKIAVALAVAAIPEGLPAVITTCLALGTKKMAKKNAIVRKLPSVETLGCTSVICSDKTGTLTTNEMVVQTLFVPDSVSYQLKQYKCKGIEFSPVGQLYMPDNKKNFNFIKKDDTALKWFAKCAANCNGAKIIYQNNKYMRQGEPTEAAVLCLLEKMGCPDESINKYNLQKYNRKDPMAYVNYWSQQSKQLATLEFTRERKSMSVICHEIEANKNVIYVKGAPESILNRSTSYMLEDGTILPITNTYRSMVTHNFNTLANQALRVLAFGIRFDCGPFEDYTGPKHTLHETLKDYSKYTEIESDLTFIGLVGIIDPPRPEVYSAIKQCRCAGIKVIMITGDNKLTAQAIANEIGLAPDKTTKTIWSLTGSEFEALNEDDQLQFLSNDGMVLSRMEPLQKQNIVRKLRLMGETVAVTGDGVNDAPALKLADIGVSMGLTGTEVAKEASDMILADDNFSTIVSAVQEGRSIYNNMKAFIRYLISSNIGEVISIFITAALGIPEGLAPVQLLWVNLVTDGLPAIALGFNPPDINVMKEPPRNKNEQLISNWVFFRYFIVGTYVGFATVFIFIWWYCYDYNSPDGHTLVPYTLLSNYTQCVNWSNFEPVSFDLFDSSSPCNYFTKGKLKASTLSLTVLVMIEMFNAFNALSEYASLLEMPPFVNPYLIVAASGSVIVHCVILYNPFFAKIFGVVPLTAHDWFYVLLLSFPVIIIDEILKYIGRPSLHTPKAVKVQLTELKNNKEHIKSH